MHNQPSGAAYDVVLLLHVACVVVGIVTIATAAATARRLGRLARTAAPLPEPLRRYFRPGVNWAGRTIYGIPVFGFALLGMSHGAYAVTDGWVLSGLVIFVALALLAEGVLWPAERRLQHAVAAAGTPAAGLDAVPPPPEPFGTVTADAARMERAASGALVLLVAATVLMIAQP
jgi:small-conductance mechanosensitive channel